MSVSAVALLPGGLRVDLGSGRVEGGGVGLTLSPKQTRLLAVLWSRVGQIISFEDIFFALWPEDFRPMERSETSDRAQRLAQLHTRLRRLKSDLGARLAEAGLSPAPVTLVDDRGLKLESPASGPDAEGLVGRTRELALLQAALAAPPRRVWVYGPPGVGVSALLGSLPGALRGAPDNPPGSVPPDPEWQGEPAHLWVLDRIDGGGKPTDDGVEGRIAALQRWQAEVPERAVVVGAWRPPPADWPGLELSALPTNAVERLARQSLGSGASASLIAALVQRAAGLPAVVAAAATWVPLLGTSGLEELLADDSAGSRGGWGRVLEEQAAAALGPQIDTLAPALRELLEACACFEGTFLALDLDGPASVPGLSVLIHRGLVLAQGERLRVPALVAERARPHHAADEVARRRRHAEALLRRVEPDLPPAILGDPAALTRLRRWVPELRAAARHCPALAPALLAAAVPVLEADGGGGGLVAVIDTLPGPALEQGALPVGLAAELLRARGVAARRAGLGAPERDLMRAIALDPRSLPASRARISLGLWARDRGEPTQAVSALLEAEAAAAAAGHTWVEARAAASLAAIYLDLFQSDACDRAVRRALALAERAGDALGLARGLATLALLYRRQGLPGLAVATLEKALQLHHQRGDAAAAAGTRVNLGAALLDQGELRRAEDCFHEAHAALSALGNRRHAAAAQLNLGLLACADGRLREAGRRLDKARVELYTVGDHRQEQVAATAHVLVRLCRREPGAEAALDELRRRARGVSAEACAWSAAIQALRLSAMGRGLPGDLPWESVVSLSGLPAPVGVLLRTCAGAARVERPGLVRAWCVEHRATDHLQVRITRMVLEVALSP